MKSRVFEVTMVTLDIQKTHPLTLVVKAKGLVSSAGWKNGQLAKYIYKQAPVDGIYEFDFIANSPDDEMMLARDPEVISDIEAEEFVWKDFPSDLKGVKVYSSNNFITAFTDSGRVENFNSADNEQLPFNKVTPEQLEGFRKDSKPFFISNAFIWEDTLHVTVNYGGGCKKHDFQIVWDGKFIKTLPPKIPLVILHNNNQDPCKARISEDLQFVLSEHVQHGAILALEGWRSDLNF